MASWKQTFQRWGIGSTGGLLMAAVLMTVPSGCQQAPVAPAEITPIVEGQMTFKPLWSRLVALDEQGGEHVINAWRLGEQVVVSTSVTTLVALNAKAGTIQWRTEFTDKRFKLLKPALTDNKKSLIVINQVQAWKVDVQTGAINKQENFEFAAASDPVVAGDSLFVGGAADYLHCLHVNIFARPKWTIWSPKDTFTNPVTVTPGNITAVSSKGLIWRTNSDKGGTGWERRVTGEGAASATADSTGTLLLVPSLDRKLYCFDVISGNLSWEVRLDGRLDQPARIAPGVILQVGSGKGLYGVTPGQRGGEIKWFTPGITKVLMTASDRAYCQNEANDIVAVDLVTGKVSAKATLPGIAGMFVFGNSEEGIIYTIAPTGRVYAFSTR